MSVHSVGWWRLIMLLMRLFHPSDTLFVQFPSVKVVSWTFHKTGWNRAGVWHVRCPLLPTGRETPSTYVSAKYCSSERPSSGAIDFSQDSPVVTSATGRKAIPSTNEMAELIVVLSLGLGVNGCLIYRFRFYRTPVSGGAVFTVAVFTRCLFYRCPFYQLPNLPFPFLPWILKSLGLFRWNSDYWAF